MARKISFLVLSAAILVSGIIGFNKLDYWNRSVRIFNQNSDAQFEGRTGRRPGEREEFSRQREQGERFVRPEMREMPDSIRARFDQREGLPGSGMRGREIPDSLRRQFGPGGRDRMGQSSPEGRLRNARDRGRGEFAGGKKINLRNVMWFLAVFAAFTVIAIYLDKAFCLIRKRKSR
ncbi:MAG: hypothetical protein E4H43_01785 [Bacteroidia bacterium]|nr:MAG: hypothetical protein E4H43_01785 [Bacteroidia bacterium]